VISPKCHRCLELAALGLGLAVASAAAAKPWWMRGVESNDGDFLPPDVAFRVSATRDGPVLHVRWLIADRYYLYKAKMQIQAESPDLTVGSAAFPPGIVKNDPFLGSQEIFVRQVEATVPFARTDGGAHPLQIKVTYQGCAEAGLCYPPITRVLFPAGAATPPPNPTHAWEGIAILGGGLAFLVAGLWLRAGRQLPMPA
jgi:thiol:disulfide interchange protein DsbD